MSNLSGGKLQICVAFSENLNFSVIEITRPLALDLPPPPLLPWLASQLELRKSLYLHNFATTTKRPLLSILVTWLH